MRMCRCVGVDVHPCVAGRRRLDALVAVGEGGGAQNAGRWEKCFQQIKSGGQERLSGADEGYTLLPISRALHAASK